MRSPGLHWLGELALAGLAAGLWGCAGAPAQDTRLERERQEVVFTAQAMLGRPYRYGGSSPARGFDCSGLVYYAYRKAGIELPRSTGAQLAKLRPVRPEALRPGDVLFFRIGGKPSHVGIYIGGGEFIHAPSSGKRVSRARLEDPYWRARLVRAGSYF